MSSFVNCSEPTTKTIGDINIVDDVVHVVVIGGVE